MVMSAQGAFASQEAIVMDSTPAAATMDVAADVWEATNGSSTFGGDWTLRTASEEVFLADIDDVAPDGTVLCGDFDETIHREDVFAAVAGTVDHGQEVFVAQCSSEDGTFAPEAVEVREHVPDHIPEHALEHVRERLLEHVPDMPVVESGAVDDELASHRAATPTFSSYCQETAAGEVSPEPLAPHASHEDSSLVVVQAMEEVALEPAEVQARGRVEPDPEEVSAVAEAMAVGLGVMAQADVEPEPETKLAGEDLILEEEEEEDDSDEEPESDDTFVPSGEEKDVEAAQLLPGQSASHIGGKARETRATSMAATPLHLSVLCGDLKAFSEVLQQKPEWLDKAEVLGRTPLHLVLLRCQPDFLRVALTVDAEVVKRAVQRPLKTSGGCLTDCHRPLHLALNTASFEACSEDVCCCLEQLLAHPSVHVDDCDSRGRTPLHLACLQGCARAVETLLRHRANPGARDDSGNYPLHCAIISRRRSCIHSILMVSQSEWFQGELHPLYTCIQHQAWDAALLLYNMDWCLKDKVDVERAFECASSKGVIAEWSWVCEKGASAADFQDLVWPTDLFPERPPTVVLTHPLCLEHGFLPHAVHDLDDLSARTEGIRDTPENRHRLEILCGEHGVLRSDMFQAARWISDPCPAPIVDVLRVHEFSYIHHLMEKVKQVGGDDSETCLYMDGDTKVSRESWAAALRACGCVIEAVDLVMKNEARNAFCAVRPPGHHLGPAGACDNKDLEDDPEGSQGFCLLNNVAIGAAYARCMYRHIVDRVAIIDFDVHHGNGTEAIVRNLLVKPTASKSVEMNLRGQRTKIEVSSPPSYKPWLNDTDAEKVFFASIHGYGRDFYPHTGAACNEMVPRIINVPLRPASDSSDFRHMMRTKLLPDLQAFGPSIVFISAGFDGHQCDMVGNCAFLEEDYFWATQQLLSIANQCCQGRLISVLEGGYNTRAEGVSPFAMAVSAHVRALMHTSEKFTKLDGHVEAPTHSTTASPEEQQQQLHLQWQQDQEEKFAMLRSQDLNRCEDIKQARAARRETQAVSRQRVALGMMSDAADALGAAGEATAEADDGAVADRHATAEALLARSRATLEPGPEEEDGDGVLDGPAAKVPRLTDEYDSVYQ